MCRYDDSRTLLGVLPIDCAERPDERGEARVAAGEPDLAHRHGGMFEQIAGPLHAHVAEVFGRTDLELGLEGPLELADRDAEPSRRWPRPAVRCSAHFSISATAVEHEIVANAGAQAQLQPFAIGRRADAVMHEPFGDLPRQGLAVMACR